jgi:hypothetical protein
MLPSNRPPTAEGVPRAPCLRLEFGQPLGLPGPLARQIMTGRAGSIGLGKRYPAAHPLGSNQRLLIQTPFPQRQLSTHLHPVNQPPGSYLDRPYIRPQDPAALDQGPGLTAEGANHVGCQLDLAAVEHPRLLARHTGETAVEAQQKQRVAVAGRRVRRRSDTPGWMGSWGFSLPVKAGGHSRRKRKYF